MREYLKIWNVLIQDYFLRWLQQSNEGNIYLILPSLLCCNQREKNSNLDDSKFSNAL